MLPDSILRSYLEPLLALGDIIDLNLDKEMDWPMSQAGPEDLVEQMATAGIDRSVLLPLDWGMVEEPKIGVEAYNDWVFESSSVYPDKLIPFIGVDPQRKDACRLLVKYIKKFDARGVKVYPATGWYPEEERLRPFWDLVDDHGLIVVTHAGASWGPLDEKYNHPLMFQKVLEDHPRMRLVVAHLGGMFRDEMYHLLEACPNAYADCSALQGWLPSNPEVALERLREAGKRIPDRVLFGSDWPIFDLAYCHAYWRGFVSDEPWASDEVKAKLLGENFLRLMSE
ncbi:MAG: Amidohydrolase [Methanomassiliicoccales archaeon PtaU1.Bin124]|nr:MAG: Amidohydrolase [Methanomassiliicoccales archaeon PtaU1.Bin124]